MFLGYDNPTPTYSRNHPTHIAARKWGQCVHSYRDVIGATEAHPWQVPSDTCLYIKTGSVHVDLLQEWNHKFPNTILAYHRKNLRDLASIDEGESKNCGRRFWLWLARQPWRRMLPAPREFFESNYGKQDNRVRPMLLFCVFFVNHIMIANFNCLRVQVVLVEQSWKEPYYLGTWHLFLPSDVKLGQMQH